MATNAFYDLFLDLLKDTFSAENQIVEALTKAIKAASTKELKEALSNHLSETKTQIERLKKIFKLLNENPTGRTCEAMTGILKEGQDMINLNTTPLVRDAGSIVACQKVEHYEIAIYGSIRPLPIISAIQVLVKQLISMKLQNFSNKL